MKFIKLPTGNRIRADIITMVSSFNDLSVVIVDFKGHGHESIHVECLSFEAANALADSIVAEIEAATGGANEP